MRNCYCNLSHRKIFYPHVTTSADHELGFIPRIAACACQTSVVDRTRTELLIPFGAVEVLDRNSLYSRNCLASRTTTEMIQMPSRQTTSFASASTVEASSRTFRPPPNWFLIRAIPLGIFALWIFAAAPRAAVLGAMSVFGVALLWLVSRTSAMTLNDEGFAYSSLGKPSATHRWSDIEAFYVVEQKALGLIPMNRYLGWNYSPDYDKSRRRSVTRAVARWTGMTEAMIKPLGLNIRELVPVMNEHLARARGVDVLD